MIATLVAHWAEIAVALVCVGVCAVAGGLSTEIGPWYRSLRFPRLKPPDWAFGPGWTTIFLFIAASGVVGWDAADTQGRTLMIWLFAINFILNLLWSPLFFKLHRPDWALVEWVFFWLSIVALVVAMFSISTLAGWLMTPYLAWVTYAGWLNWRVVVLNRPFGALAPGAAGTSRRPSSDGRRS